MEIAGKCPPDRAELTAAADRGFDRVELYLEKGHLDSFHETVTVLQETPIDVVSVHTPHVKPDEPRYFEQADDLAEAMNAVLVVHSQYLHHTHIPDLEAIGFDAPYAYENIPGASGYHVENAILEQGHKLALDTAHLYMAEEDFVTTFERFLRGWGSRIPVVHLNDATVTRDGLSFDSGEIDLRTVVASLEETFSGYVVLEVMPEHQRDGLENIRRWLGDDNARR